MTRNPTMKRQINAACESCGHDVRDHKKQGTDRAECLGGTRGEPCNCAAYVAENKLL